MLPLRPLGHVLLRLVLHAPQHVLRGHAPQPQLLRRFLSRRRLVSLLRDLVLPFELLSLLLLAAMVGAIALARKVDP